MGRNAERKIKNNYKRMDNILIHQVSFQFVQDLKSFVKVHAQFLLQFVS